MRRIGKKCNGNYNPNEKPYDLDIYNDEVWIISTWQCSHYLAWETLINMQTHGPRRELVPTSWPVIWELMHAIRKPNQITVHLTCLWLVQVKPRKDFFLLKEINCFLIKEPTNITMETQCMQLLRQFEKKTSEHSTSWLYCGPSELSSVSFRQPFNGLFFPDWAKLPVFLIVQYFLINIDKFNTCPFEWCMQVHNMISVNTPPTHLDQCTHPDFIKK